MSLGVVGRRPLERVVPPGAGRPMASVVGVDTSVAKGSPMLAPHLLDGC
jgi:hypothetical protein